MRSLWRNLALQWLGGDASEALTGDSTVLESLPVGDTGQTTPVFDVQREPGVSHRAMLIPGDVGRTSPEYSAEEVLRDASERLSLLTQSREAGGRRS